MTNLSDDDNSESETSLPLKNGGIIVSNTSKFGSDGSNGTFYPKGFRKDSPSRNTGWGDNDNVTHKDDEWADSHRSSSSNNNGSWASAGVNDKTSNSWVSSSDSQEKENEGPSMISGSGSWQSAARGGLGGTDNMREASSSTTGSKTRRPPPKGTRPERMKMPSKMKNNDNVNPDFEIEDDNRGSRDRINNKDRTNS
jgi:hypothetical protein